MKEKAYHELTFADDYMFCKVLQNNEDLCQRVLELILGRKVAHIVKIGRQQPIEITPDGKGVRFDVYLEDEESIIYDVEMQNARGKDLPLRARYYQSMIDLDCMDRGMGYNELKKSVIIFICAFDPLGGGLARYTVKPHVQETGGSYDDGTEKVFLSTVGLAEDVPEELREFLAYVAGSPAQGDLTKALEEQVERAKGHQEWRQEYMTLYEIKEEIKREIREEALEEGRAAGLEEGRAEGRAEVAKALKEKGVPLNIIIEATGMTEDAIAQL